MVVNEGAVWYTTKYKSIICIQSLQLENGDSAYCLKSC